MKDIKDYLHLYLNAPCEMTALRAGWDSGQYVFSADILFWVMRGDVSVKLHLRPLSDMTVEEAKQLDQIGFSLTYPNGYLRAGDGNTYRNISILGVSEAVQFLLSKGFDLFGLIEAGLAIDKTTLKQKV